MTPTRRTRKSALSSTNTASKSNATTSSTKKQKCSNLNTKSNQQPYTTSSDDEEEEDDGEESSDAGSVTRCICGEAHNLGLMVQCDKCEVWQHCECIGLIQDKLPDQYYCDKCQPENHQTIKTSSGRSKRLYLVDSKNNPNEPPVSSPQINSDKRLSKRRKKTDSPVSEQASPIIKTASPQVESLSVDEVVSTTANSTNTTTGSTRSTRRNTNKEDLHFFEDVIISNKRPAKTSPTIVTRKEGSPTTANHNEPYWNYTSGKPTRASSPPAKVKYPNTKMTFSDMNKRAKQIMDCISKWQPVSSPGQLSHASLLLFESQYKNSRPRSLSTSSSSSSCLSNASTVPLLLDDYTTTEGSSPSTPLPYLQQQQQHQQQTQKHPHEEPSLEIIERINHELTKFQRKYGIMYQEPKVNKSTTTA